MDYQHKCIKPDCINTYTDKDPDAYYCETCREQNKIIAKQIDSRVGSVKRQTKSIFSEKDFQGRHGRIFFNANDYL